MLECLHSWVNTEQFSMHRETKPLQANLTIPNGALVHPESSAIYSQKERVFRTSLLITTLIQLEN